MQYCQNFPHKESQISIKFTQEKKKYGGIPVALTIFDFITLFSVIKRHLLHF